MFTKNYKKVYLIGAGPGSPDLLTVRGLRFLRQADVVISDALIPPSYYDELGLTTEGVRIVYPTDGHGRSKQKQVNRLLLDYHRSGRAVVRLKNGDPFVFGRLQEETDFLDGHDIPWEVVPAPSACTAGPAAADLPLTRRGAGRSFAVVTARQAGGKLHATLPKADSLLIFMAVKVLSQTTEQLLNEGWSAETPAAIVERACQPWSRRVDGCLGTIARLAIDEGIASPAILLVGEGARPTERSRYRPAILFAGTHPESAWVFGHCIHWPAIESVHHERGWTRLPVLLNDLSAFDMIVFNEPHDVIQFFTALNNNRRDARALAGIEIVVRREETAWRLREYGVHADHVIQSYASNTLFSEQNVLLIHKAKNSKQVCDQIKETASCADVLSFHDVRPHPALGRSLPEHDTIFFTTPAEVEAWFAAYGYDGFTTTALCQDQQTFYALEKLGVDVGGAVEGETLKQMS
jgi:uroporphyrinogen III methyltransferase/synthase